MRAPWLQCVSGGAERTVLIADVSREHEQDLGPLELANGLLAPTKGGARHSAWLQSARYIRRCLLAYWALMDQMPGVRRSSSGPNFTNQQGRIRR
jgi:hypothetical protein